MISETFRNFCREQAVNVATMTTCLLPGVIFASPRLLHAPSPDDPIGVSIHQLENGLTIYLSVNPLTPRVYTEIAVRAGSKHDPAETTGLAHYLEHLLFKGSEKLGTLDFAAETPFIQRIEELYEAHFREEDPEARKALYAKIDEASREAARFAIPNEFDKLYSAIGGDAINAHTSTEETVYKAGVPSAYLEHWARIESDRFTAPVYRLFQTELETVYEEKNRSLDNAQRVIWEAIEKTLYQVHPYGQQTTLGEPEHLKRPSLVNIRRFFETWYVPNNMAICISGDIDRDKTLEVIAQYFSGLTPRELPALPAWTEPPLDATRRVEVTYPGEEMVVMAYRTVANGHPDRDALIMLDMVMDNATAGMIHLNLAQVQKVKSAGAYPRFQNDYGAHYFYGTPLPGQTLEDVEFLLRGQLALMQAGEFDADILPAILNDFRKQQMRGLEQDATRVAAMRRSFISGQSWEYEVRALERLAQVTPADIIRVARAYFGGGYAVAYRRNAPHPITPIEKPPLTPAVIDTTRQSAFASEILALPAAEIHAAELREGHDFFRAQSGGRTWITAPNPVHDLFDIKIVIEKGSRHDPLLPVAARLLRLAGAGDRDARALSMEWYRLGSDAYLDVGPAETTLTLAGLGEHFETTMERAREWLTKPTLAADTLPRLIEVLLKERADQMEHPDHIARALTAYNRHGAQSDHLTALTSEALRALTVEDVLNSLNRLLTLRQMVLYTGSLELPALEKSLGRLWPLGEDALAPPPYPALHFTPTDRTSFQLVARPLAQSRIRIEMDAGSFDATETPWIMAYNEFFGGGMSSVVFQEIRESRALAYSAWAHFWQGNVDGDRNLLIGSIGTQADKTNNALDAFMALFATWPASEARHRTVLSALDQQYRAQRIHFREIPQHIRTWQKQGHQADPRAAWNERIQKISAEDLHDFARRRIEKLPARISIVGDPSRFDQAQLERMGPVREVQVSELFAP